MPDDSRKTCKDMGCCARKRRIFAKAEGGVVVFSAEKDTVFAPLFCKKYKERAKNRQALFVQHGE